MGGLAVKKIAIMLATIIFIQLGATSVFADYTDVSGHWALRFINELTDKKIVEGDNLAFRPDSNVNVDEFIKMVIAAMDIEVTPQPQNWSAPYIEKALQKQLIYKDEFDKYNRPIKRCEIAKICVRAIGADEVSGNERNELISRISDYYDIYNKDKEYVLAAYSKHLLYGYEDNSFRSERYTTRAEACVIISRMIKVGNFTNNNGGIIDNPILKNIIYVANTGNDENDGTIDSPLKTLEKARDKVREIISSGNYPDGGITVYLRGGDYVLDKSLELGSNDSGTENNPVTYSSYPGEVARITGGTKLPYNEFKKISSDMASKLLDKTVSDKVLELDLGKMGIEDLGQLSRRGYGISADVIPQAELYIDSDRMQLARWPNSDWVGTTDIVRSGARSKKGVLEGAVYKIDYDRPTKWKTNINEIYTSGVLGPNYFYGYFPIEKIEPGQILVSGRVPVIGDDEKEVSVFYVQSQGEILAETGKTYVKEMPLIRKVRYPAGKKRYGLRLIIGPFSFSFLMPRSGKSENKENWDYTVDMIQCRLFSSFYLPLFVGKITGEYMTVYEKGYTEAELEQTASETNRQFVEKLKEKGVQILENNDKIEKNISGYRISGKLTVIEPAAVRAPVSESSISAAH